MRAGGAERSAAAAAGPGGAGSTFLRSALSSGTLLPTHSPRHPSSRQNFTFQCCKQQLQHRQGPGTLAAPSSPFLSCWPPPFRQPPLLAVRLPLQLRLHLLMLPHHVQHVCVP